MGEESLRQYPAILLGLGVVHVRGARPKGCQLPLQCFQPDRVCFVEASDYGEQRRGGSAGDENRIGEEPPHWAADEGFS